jgi:hypothetical protein
MAPMHEFTVLPPLVNAALDAPPPSPFWPCTPSNQKYVYMWIFLHRGGMVRRSIDVGTMYCWSKIGSGGAIESPFEPSLSPSLTYYCCPPLKWSSSPHELWGCGSIFYKSCVLKSLDPMSCPA